MLKDNAIPTLFDHNKDKQHIKRISTLSRNETAQKKQYCEEAFELYDKFEKYEYEINSKEIQTTPETRTIETQTDIIYQEKSIQCNIQKDTEMYASQNEMSVYSDESDNELMTWTHHLYFPKVIAVVVATLIQMTIKMIEKARHLLFSGRLW